MEYLVLARKYRPQTFAEMVGQEHVTRTLANAIERGRIHHAFLFTGARGVGKTTAARILAKALCCEKGPTPTPCGTCDPCIQIRGGTAIDVVEIDGASNNGVDNVRELREAARYQPAHLRRKVYILDEVHMLSSGAFNALLKTLEEPPPHVTFVFATTEAHKIPITILSRCQRYDFKLLSDERLRGHLADVLGREGVAVEPGALALVAREAGGSVRDALSLLDQVLAFAAGERLTENLTAEALGVADRAVLRALATAVLRRDARAALETLGAACDRGYELLPLVRAFLGVLRDLAVVKAAPESALLEASPSEIEELRALAGEAPAGVLGMLFDRTARALEEATRSPVPRLVAEMALLDMAQLEPLQPLGDLLDRLEALEGRLGGSAAGPAGRSGLGGGAGNPPARSSTSPVTVSAAPGPAARTLPGDAPAPAVAAAGGEEPGLSPGAVTAALATLSGSGASSPGRGKGPTNGAATRPAPQPAAPPQAAAAARQAEPSPLMPPAAAPAPAASMMARWEEVLGKLEVARPSLAAQLTFARVATLDLQHCELAIAPGSLLAELLAEPEARKALADALAAVLGSAPVVRVRTDATVVEAAPAESLAEVEARREGERLAAREREARNHPVVKAAVAAFGAEIKEVRHKTAPK